MGDTRKRQCCCGCKVGAVIPRWYNVTQVRQATGTNTSWTVANAAPFSRLDLTYDVSSYGGHACATAPPGFCNTKGNWVIEGDLNGVISQAITDGTDDILACDAPDATHYTLDHNCYQQFPSVGASGFITGESYRITTAGSTDFTAIGAANNNVGTVFAATGAGSGTGAAQMVADMRAPKLFGAQWILARKMWHGALPLNSQDPCTLLPTNTADQTKYLKINRVCNYTRTVITTGSLSAGTTAIGTYVSQAEVDRYTGKLTQSSTAAMTDVTFDYWNEGDLVKSADALVSIINSTNPQCDTVGFEIVPGAEQGSLPYTGPLSLTDLQTSISNWFSTFWAMVEIPAPDGGGNGSSRTFAWNAATLTSTELILDFTAHNISNQPSAENPSLNYTMDLSWNFRVEVTLSVPYTAADCYADFLTLQAAWNLSDLTLAKFRQDEKLAAAPLVIYDGVQTPTPLPFSVPIIYNSYAVNGYAISGATTMDDYNSPIADSNGIAPFHTYENPATLPYIYDSSLSSPQKWSPTWAQIAWHDPYDLVWKYPAGSTMATGGLEDAITKQVAYAGATLLTGLLTGNILAHTMNGSGRHFWFKAEVWERQSSAGPDPATPYTWNLTHHGDFSDTNLPEVAMRWMSKPEAQYDPDSVPSGIAPDGNFPQAWWSEKGGVLKGGKYVQATQTWPAQKFCRPCGVDKYAVKMETVCCFTGDATAGFNITLTNNATTLPAGGDYILVGGVGIFQVNTVVAGLLTTTSTTPIDILPAGLGDQSIANGDFLGVLRWINYTQYGASFTSPAGIELRVPVTTSYASGVLTVLPTSPQPFLRKDPTIAAIRAVNLYDANMTLLASGLVLARTDDSTFTVTTSNHPTAAWMMDTGFAAAISANAATDWTKYDGTSKKTGVKFEWTFDQRAAAKVAALQPPWLGGNGTAGSGLVGCLESGYTNAQYNFTGNCPAAIGIVPFYSPPADTSGNQPDQNSQPPENQPVEQFPNQEMFDFPAVVMFDDYYGAHWQAAIMLTATDALWERPFVPDCTNTITWIEDDGSGNSGSDTTKYFAHHPLVEALASVPSGCALPVGVYLPYDIAHNQVVPPAYPNGIAVSAGNTAGYYEDIATEYGFALLACATIAAARPFSADYTKFVSC